MRRRIRPMGAHAQVVRTGAAAPAERQKMEGDDLTIDQLQEAILMLDKIREQMMETTRQLTSLRLRNTADRLDKLRDVVEIDMSYLVAISNVRRARTGT